MKIHNRWYKFPERLNVYGIEQKGVTQEEQQLFTILSDTLPLHIELIDIVISFLYSHASITQWEYDQQQVENLIYNIVTSFPKEIPHFFHPFGVARHAR